MSEYMCIIRSNIHIKRERQREREKKIKKMIKIKIKIICHRIGWLVSLDI